MLQRHFCPACIFYFNFGAGFIFIRLKKDNGSLGQFSSSAVPFFPLGIVGKRCACLTLDQSFLQSVWVRRLNPPFHASPLHNQGQPFRREQNYSVWQAGQMAGNNACEAFWLLLRSNPHHLKDGWYNLSLPSVLWRGSGWAMYLCPKAFHGFSCLLKGTFWENCGAIVEE